MKDFDISTYGVEEITSSEQAQINGGFIEFLYELITGRSLASDTRKAAIAVHEDMVNSDLNYKMMVNGH